MQIWMSEKYEFTSLSRVSSVSHGGDGINLIKNDFKGISYTKKYRWHHYVCFLQ